MNGLLHESDNSGKLDCGCVISLVVSATPPRGQISMCPTHRGAHKLRQTLNLIMGLAGGAQEAIRISAAPRTTAISKLQTIEVILRRVLGEIDPIRHAVPVQKAGPGKEE